MNAVIILAYSLPALLAAFLTVTVTHPEPWLRAAMFLLPWITAVLGTVVFMVAVSREEHGLPVRLGQVSLIGLTWVPRYLWTNAHTSAIFWAPIGVLLLARAWLEGTIPPGSEVGVVVGGLCWIVIGAVALAVHTRTLLAPFLAIHADLPGTLAAFEAWRVSGRHFAPCLGTLIMGSFPVALPVALLALAGVLLLPEGALSRLQLAAEDLAWAGIQTVRLVLIPALYALYSDLWRIEALRQEVRDPIPPAVRGLLRLTTPLPHLGRDPLAN
jgi:hypothetical protein